jgi:PIN domain nuclease of toxin-antitoxin system
VCPAVAGSSSCVPDASALLAFLRYETGGDLVEPLLREVCISNGIIHSRHRPNERDGPVGPRLVRSRTARGEGVRSPKATALALRVALSY